MVGIKIEVTGNIARVTQKPKYITSGTVGLPVEFTFSDEWDGLDKTAVFQAGHVCKIVSGLGKVTTLPWEVLQNAHKWLSIGVYGENEDGSVAIPTIWANVKVIDVGTSPNGDGCKAPAKAEWTRMLIGQSAYELAVELGYAGSEEQWLESLHGAPVELRSVNDMLQWRFQGEAEESWQSLFDMATIRETIFQKAQAEAKKAEEAAGAAKGYSDAAGNSAASAKANADRAAAAAGELEDVKPKDVIVTAEFEAAFPDGVTGAMVANGASSMTALGIATAIRGGATVKLIDNDNIVYEYDGYRLEPSNTMARFKAKVPSEEGIKVYRVNIDNELYAGRVETLIAYGGGTVFGVPYSVATKTFDISASGDGSVMLYLFDTVDGYDAVVAGSGATADYTAENRPYDVENICRLHIEKGVTSIGDCFMDGANNLKCVSFEDSKAVKHLGKRAFALTQISGEYDFSGLTDTKLDRTFFTCRRLEGVTLNGKIAEIASMSFAVCPSLRYVKDIASGGAACIFGDAAFEYCTNLESVGVTPANTTLGKYVFLLTPIDAKVADTNTNIADAAWKSKGFLCFAQNEWTAEQLAAIRGVTSDTIQFPIPEADNQSAEMYYHWSVFWGIDNNWKDKVPGYGQCVHFSLFHVYNTLHPNAPYDTYYDFITREIAPKKITVTQSLYDALHNSEVWEELVALNEQYGTGVTYELGDEISATDLPVFLSYEAEEFTQYEEGTAFWGICEVLGWSAEEIFFADGVQSGADVKRRILDNLANNKPVVMFIVGAGNYGHAAHSVAVIGYDNETDRLLIIDSTDAFPADTIPLTYWREFETLITPNKHSRIFTFDFGEVITMTDIDNKLDTIMQGVSFRHLTGEFTPSEDTSEVVLSIPANAKYVEITPTGTPSASSYPTRLPVRYMTMANAGVTPRADNTFIYYEVSGQHYVSQYVGVDLSNGFSFSLESPFVLEGGMTYRWTAYYWDE